MYYFFKWIHQKTQELENTSYKYDQSYILTNSSYLDLELYWRICQSLQHGSQVLRLIVLALFTLPIYTKIDEIHYSFILFNTLLSSICIITFIKRCRSQK